MGNLWIYGKINASCPKSATALNANVVQQLRKSMSVCLYRLCVSHAAAQTVKGSAS